MGDADRGDYDESREGAGKLLVILGGAAISAELGEGPLHNRSPRLNLEAFLVVAAVDTVEGEINGFPPGERWATRDTCSRQPVEALRAWLLQNRAKPSAKAPVAKAIG